MSGTWALARNREVAVDVTLPIVPTDMRDSLEPARDMRLSFDDGESVTLATGTKIPFLSGQEK